MSKGPKVCDKCKLIMNCLEFSPFWKCPRCRSSETEIFFWELTDKEQRIIDSRTYRYVNRELFE